MLNSEPESVPALDDANSGTEPDRHDRSDKTAQRAAVAKRQDCAGAREQRTSGTRA
jgi:hypothetical protein